MTITFARTRVLSLLAVSLCSCAHAQLQAWGDYPRWPASIAAPNQGSDFQVLAEISRPAVRDWQRQQTALTQKLLNGLTERREFAEYLQTQTGVRPALAQALAWQQQHFYSEQGTDGRCRVIQRLLPVGNERTLFVCELGQRLLGFRIAADASLLAVLVQAGAAATLPGNNQVRLVNIKDQTLLAEVIPTASQHPHEIMPLPAMAGVLYRPLTSKKPGQKPELLYWHASGQPLEDDKSAFPQHGTPARLVLKNARDSKKLSLAWYAPNQLYPQIWLVDLDKWQSDKARFNWQRKFAASEQIRDLSFDDKALYWIHASKDFRGKVKQQNWETGSTVKTLNLPAKSELWQVHASDGKLWLHTLAEGRSHLLKYDLAKQQTEGLDLPLRGRLSELGGELPGFLLESTQQAPLAYQIGSDDKLKNWDIARPYIAPLELAEQSHSLAAYPGFQLRIVHRQGLPLDGKRPVILMAEELARLEQLPRFNAQWYAWLAKDGVLAWVQSTAVPPASKKTMSKTEKDATSQRICQAVLAASDYLQSQAYANASSLFLSERAPAPACWWQMMRQAPERFAAVASDQMPVLDGNLATMIKPINYPALLLSLDGTVDLKRQLSFMPVLGQLQQSNQASYRPILFRSELIGSWRLAPDQNQVDEWGFFWWRYRQEQMRGKR